MRKSLPIFLTIVFAWLFVYTLPASLAQQRLGPTYTDKEHGYSIKIPANWDQIPVPPDEKYPIAKFVGPTVEIALGKIGGIEEKPELEIILIPKITSAPTTNPEAVKSEDTDKNEAAPEQEKEKLQEEHEKKQVPRSFKDYVKNFTYYKEVRYVQDGKERKISKLKAEEFIYKDKRGISNSRPNESSTIDVVHYALVYDLEEEFIAVEFRMAEGKAGFEKWAKLFEQSAKSLRITEKDSKTVTEADSTKGNSKETKGSKLAVDEQRKKHQTDVARTQGWYLDETDHYFIKAKQEDSKFVKTLKTHIEAIRYQLEQDFPLGTPLTEKSVLRVCSNPDEYHSYGGPSGSAGYWSSAALELVVPNFKDYELSITYGVLYHEAFHQYIYYRCGEIAPHSWFNEGFGDYYAGGKLKSNRFEIGKSDLPGVGRLETVREMIRLKDEEPLANLIKMSQSEYYADGSNNYAQGWALVYFLKEGKSESYWDRTWENILPTYLETITKTKSKEKALEAATKDVDLNRLHDAWLEFCKKL